MGSYRGYYRGRFRYVGPGKRLSQGEEIVELDIRGDVKYRNLKCNVCGFVFPEHMRNVVSEGTEVLSIDNGVSKVGDEYFITYPRREGCPRCGRFDYN